MIRVLDKGHVILRQPDFSKSDIRALRKNGYDTKRLQKHIYVSLIVKAPMFVKMMFPEFGLITLTNNKSKLEVFEPTMSDVKAETPTIGQEIADDIKATSQALLINPKAYRADGCERSVSQINTPIALYNSFIVSGFLSNWNELISHNSFQPLIEDYREAIHSLIIAEYLEVTNDEFSEEEEDQSDS